MDSELLGVTKAKVGVIMGSRSDWKTMQEACEILKNFDVPFEAKVVSAHRTPHFIIEGAVAWSSSHHCGCWRSRTFTWDGRCLHTLACAGGACSEQESQGARLAVEYCADAGRSSCGHARHRCGGRKERGSIGGTNISSQ